MAPERDVAIPPEPGWNSGAVRGRLTGNVGGHQYVFGCWREFTGMPSSYGCTGAVDLRNDGSVVIKLTASEPAGTATYVLDRAKVEQVIHTAIALRASFTEPRPN